MAKGTTNTTTVPNSAQHPSPRMREAKVTLPCTAAQKRDLTLRAGESGLSVANYLRQMLGWELEAHGARKDLEL